ncbi:unnamed protein product [Hanseniaspora opuntiae]
MGVINSGDKEKIKLSIPKQFNKIIDVAIAKLYIAYPSPTEGVIWDQELYVNFDYIQDRTFFHTFEMEECLAGLLFEDTHEAQHFYKRVTKRQKYGSKNTINNKNAIKLQKEVDVENKATVVHGPRGEELISKQRSRYDYSNRIAENVGYRGSEPDYDEETDIEHSSKSKPTNEDPYAAYSFDEPVTIKQAPPPPPAAVESYDSRESSTSVSDISTSQSAAPAVLSSGPVHKLPPPPSEYVHLPPPEATMKNNLPPLPSHSNAPPVPSHSNAPPVPPHHTGYGQAPQQFNQRTGYGQAAPQPNQRTGYGQVPPQANQRTGYGQAAPQVNQRTGYGQSAQQPILPSRTGPPPPPTRKTGPPAPPRRLTGQATGGAATQPLVSQRTGGRGLPPVPPLQQQKTGGRGLPPIPPLQQQKTGGRGLPPVPPLQQQKTGGRGPPPPARRVTGQRTGHMTGAANSNSPFAISNVPVTTFGGSSLPQHQADTYQQTSHIQQTSQQAYGGYNRAQHALPQQQQSSIPAPPPMQQQQSSIPAPPPMQQQSSIPAPPPMPQQSSIPAPPPMQQQSNIPAPPPMQQQTTLNENTGDVGRDALLASIRSSGIGMLKKTDKSQIRDRSGVQVASEEKPVGAQATGGPGGLADALAAALSNRNKKVSAYADEDDGEW